MSFKTQLQIKRYYYTYLVIQNNKFHKIFVVLFYKPTLLKYNLMSYIYNNILYHVLNVINNFHLKSDYSVLVYIRNTQLTSTKWLVILLQFNAYEISRYC